MAAAHVVIGIDGGGSNTTAAVVKASDGELLSESSAGASNWNSVGRAKAGAVINEVVTAALAKVQPPFIVDAIAAGMSGLHGESDAAMVRQFCTTALRNAAAQCAPPPHFAALAFNDTMAALACGTRGRRFGIAVIAGTGSNCVGVCAEQRASAGGWGPLLGRAGGALALASSALASCCGAVDGTAAATSLVRRVESALQWPPGSYRERVIDWAYADTTDWAAIAALAPLVFDAANDGDQVAERIVEETATQLACDVAAVYARVNWRSASAVPVVLVGGLWKQPLMRNTLKQRLERDIGDSKFVLVDPVVSPAVGSALLCLRDLDLLADDADRAGSC